MHVELELFANGLDILQSFLVIGTCAANPDGSLVLNQRWGKLPEGSDNTLKSGRNLRNR